MAPSVKRRPKAYDINAADNANVPNAAMSDIRTIDVMSVRLPE